MGVQSETSEYYLSRIFLVTKSCFLADRLLFHPQAFPGSKGYFCFFSPHFSLISFRILVENRPLNVVLDVSYLLQCRRYERFPDYTADGKPIDYSSKQNGGVFSVRSMHQHEPLMATAPETFKRQPKDTTPVPM